MSNPGGKIIINDPNEWAYDGKSLKELAELSEKNDITLDELVYINEELNSLIAVILNNSYIMRTFQSLVKKMIVMKLISVK